jgi:hypothetical protein
MNTAIPVVGEDGREEALEQEFVELSTLDLGEVGGGMCDAGVIIFPK